MMADLAPALLDERQARELTDNLVALINTSIEKFGELVVRAHSGKAWEALGYVSWTAYCSAEFNTDYIRLPPELRAQLVAQLRDSGMSLRDIGPPTGQSHESVRRQLQPSPVTNVTPEPEQLFNIKDVQYQSESPASKRDSSIRDIARKRVSNRRSPGKPKRLPQREPSPREQKKMFRDDVDAAISILTEAVQQLVKHSFDRERFAAAYSTSFDQRSIHRRRLERLRDQLTLMLALLAED